MTSRRGDLPAADPRIDEQGVAHPARPARRRCARCRSGCGLPPTVGVRAIRPSPSAADDRSAGRRRTACRRNRPSPSRPSEPARRPMRPRPARRPPNPGRPPHPSRVRTPSRQPSLRRLPSGRSGPLRDRTARGSSAVSRLADRCAVQRRGGSGRRAAQPSLGRLRLRWTRARSADGPPPRSSGTRPWASRRLVRRLAGDAYAAEAPAPMLVDDAPTEAFPVAAPASGRHRADPDEDADLVAEWRAPRQTSRVTMGLLAALLVALGFFAGVLVGRTAGTATSSGDTARPAATGAARPGPLR